MLRSLIIISLICPMFVASAQDNQNLQVVSYQLDNGLTVFLNEDTTASRVFGAVMVNAGAKHEDPSATGMAHYLEHLLFKGTDRLGTWNYEEEKPHLDSITVLYEQLAQAETPEAKAKIQNSINEEAVAASKYALPNEFDKLLKSIGGTGINAFTNYDMTFYHNSFPANEVEKWLDLYSERFENPVFRSFQSELEVVYEEKNRAADSFEDRVFNKINEMTFPNLPYGQWSILGDVEHLKTPSLTKMYDFYLRHYVPGNMALILSGNINPSAVKEMIEEKFGDWAPSGVPDQQFPDLDRLKGEVVKKVRITPVKVGFYGFQTSGQSHPDRRALDVAEYLLYNNSETGLINQIELNNEMIYAGGFSTGFTDAGSYNIFFVPKIVIQSMGNAEKRIDGALTKLRNGGFTNEMLAAAKSDLSKAFQERIEDVRSRGILIGEAFNIGISWEEMLTYPNQVESISRDDVVRVANKYFGENRAKMISRTGFPKKNKLEKPPYKPVATEQTKSSSYATDFQEIPSLDLTPKFLNFENDMDRMTLDGGHQVYATTNPINDLFSLEIRYAIGNLENPKLELAAQIANYSGTDRYSLNELKQAFASIGCTYYLSTDNNWLKIALKGKEGTLKEAIVLANHLVTSISPDDKSKSVLDNTIFTDRKLEKNSPSVVARAMLSYAAYGQKSDYRRRLTGKQIKKTEKADLKLLLNKVVSEYRADFLFTGKTTAKELKSLISETYQLSPEPKNIPFQYIGYQEVEKPKILFINDKKAVQSQVYFYMDGSSLDQSDFAKKEAFNQYFGGGFSGIVLQEIREYRSLAYSAWSFYQVPPLEGEKTRFISFIGCQADKTLEAIKVMSDLLADMPVKEERIPSLKKSLQMRINTDYPDFRSLPDEILSLERLGYVEDPNMAAFDEFQKIEMEDIQSFYKERIADKPYIITIYGDQKLIDLTELRKLGEVEVIDKKDVMVF